MKSRFLIYVFLLLLLPGCSGQQSGGVAEAGDSLQFSYAKNLTVVSFPDHIEVTLRNPWNGAGTLARYCLYEAGQEPHRTDMTPVRIPLQNAAVFGSVHCALLSELGAGDAVGGICDAEFINQPELKKDIAEGRVANLGNSIQPSLEQVINLNPDALLPSPFENSGGLGRIESLGIPIIWCADYMENSPLGRAEWIRFYGRLFGRGREADSIFCCVEHRYKQLRDLAESTKTRPRLLPEMPWSGQWTLPGSGSGSTRLYEDAGANYLFADLEGSGGIPLSTEKVVDRGINADVWLIKHHGPLDRKQMNADTPLLANIRAKIWWCDTSKKFIYEETPFHPERLLEDLISILHPELEIEAEHHYFEMLKQ